MVKSNLQTAQNNWGKRRSAALAAGYSLQDILPIQQMDIAKVGQGHTGMTDQEAIQAISAAGGDQQIHPPNVPSGVTHVLGNVSGDIRNIVTGITGAIVHPSTWMKEFVNTPKVVEESLNQNPANKAKLQAQGLETGGLGAILRNVGEHTAASFVPGVADLAMLTNNQGRQELTRTPVSSALDVLPEVGGLGKLAAVSRLGKDLGAAGEAGNVGGVTAKDFNSASMLGKISLAQKAYKQAIGEKSAVGPSRANTLESLSRGKPLQALSRATGASAKFQEYARVLKISSDIGTVVGTLKQYTRGAYGQLDDPQYLIDTHLKELPSFKDLPESEQHQLEDIVKNFKPEQAWAISNASRISDSHLSIINQAFYRAGVDGWVQWMINNKVAVVSTDELMTQLDHIPQNLREKYILGYKEWRPSSHVPWNDNYYHPERALKPGERVPQGAKVTRRVSVKGDPVTETITQPGSSKTLTPMMSVQEQLAALKQGGWKVVSTQMKKAEKDLKSNKGTRTQVPDFYTLRNDQGQTIQMPAKPVPKPGASKKVGTSPRTITRTRAGKSHTQTYIREPIYLNIPKHIHEALYKEDSLFRGYFSPVPEKGSHGPGTQLGRAIKGATGFWKDAIFTTPRHMVHIGIGGMMHLIAETEFKDVPHTISNFKRAYAVGMGHEFLPEIVSQSISRYTGDQIYELTNGFKVGSLLKAIPGAPERFQQHITDTYKALAYFQGHDRLLKSATKKGAGVDQATLDSARQAGIEAANRVLISTDKMTPIESSLVRTIFPFYGFTKHLFDFLGTFPAEHPWRAQVLSQIADQETANWNSGLPYMWQQMLFMGKPDANGNVKSVDVRSINPFRSFFNDFSIAGITMSLSPMLGLGLDALGVNKLTGAPDLYPNMQYNPQTGSLQAAPTSLGSFVSNAADDFFPQLSSLRSLIGVADQYKSLRAEDPQAFASALRTSFGLPFLPQQINISQTKGRAADNVYKVAQTAVSHALATGDFSQVRNFNLVPYNGQFISPQSLEAFYNSMNSQYGAEAAAAGTDIKAVMVKPKSQKPQFPQYAG